MGLQINPNQRKKAENNIKQAKAGKAKHIYTAPDVPQSKPSKSRTVKSSNKTKKPIVHHYRNIRTDASIVNTLEEFQYVTGFRSRSDLLKRMIEIAKPVFLNSPERNKQFHFAKEFVSKRNKIKHE